MSQGVESPDPDDTLLRRIPVSDGYFNPDKDPPVGKGAFTPNSDDADGLSFFLERETSVATLVSSGKPGKTYKVARFRASEIYSLGLTLKPDQQPGDLPGHHLVTEINLTTYKSKETRSKTSIYCIELARLANSRLIDPNQSQSVAVPA